MRHADAGYERGARGRRASAGSGSPWRETRDRAAHRRHGRRTGCRRSGVPATSADLVDRREPEGVSACRRRRARSPISVRRFLSVRSRPMPSSRRTSTCSTATSRRPPGLRLLAGRDLRAAAATRRTCSRCGGSTGSTTSCAEAWESGVVLAGLSAGANCWFEASTTDSFGRARGPLARRARAAGGQLLSALRGRARSTSRSYQRLVGDGFPPGIACDDRAAVHYVGIGARGRRDIVRPRGVPGLHARRRGDEEPASGPTPPRAERPLGVGGSLAPCRSGWGER